MPISKKTRDNKFKASLCIDIPAALQSKVEYAPVLNALSKIKSSNEDLLEFVSDLALIEAELRSTISEVANVNPDLARGLSKLCDIAANSDFLTPDAMLENLEFLNSRIKDNYERS